MVGYYLYLICSSTLSLRNLPDVLTLNCCSCVCYVLLMQELDLSDIASHREELHIHSLQMIADHSVVILIGVVLTAPSILLLIPVLLLVFVSSVNNIASFNIVVRRFMVTPITSFTGCLYMCLRIHLLINMIIEIGYHSQLQIWKRKEGALSLFEQIWRIAGLDDSEANKLLYVQVSIALRQCEILSSNTQEVLYDLGEHPPMQIVPIVTMVIACHCRKRK